MDGDDTWRSLAVVVGIGDYRHPIATLHGAVPDAKGVGRALGELGYVVKEYVDGAATRDALKTLVERGWPISSERAGYQRLLVYFAGHGAMDEGEGVEGYILPHDARHGEVETFLSMRWLPEAFEGVACHHRL
ncbi:MAG: caspase family protein [bacterium]